MSASRSARTSTVGTCGSRSAVASWNYGRGVDPPRPVFHFADAVVVGVPVDNLPAGGLLNALQLVSLGVIVQGHAAAMGGPEVRQGRRVAGRVPVHRAAIEAGLVPTAVAILHQLIEDAGRGRAEFAA